MSTELGLNRRSRQRPRRVGRAGSDDHRDGHEQQARDPRIFKHPSRLHEPHFRPARTGCQERTGRRSSSINGAGAASRQVAPRRASERTTFISDRDGGLSVSRGQRPYVRPCPASTQATVAGMLRPLLPRGRREMVRCRAAGARGAPSEVVVSATVGAADYRVAQEAIVRPCPARPLRATAVGQRQQQFRPDGGATNSTPRTYPPPRCLVGLELAGSARVGYGSPMPEGDRLRFARDLR